MGARLDEAALSKIKRAAEEASWLLARDYPAAAVSSFVAEHRGLDDDERHLLATNARLSAQVRHHIARELDPEDVCRRLLRVDAESVIAMVAAASSGSQLLESPAGLRIDPDFRRGNPLGDDTMLANAVGRCCRALAPLRPKRSIFVIEDGHPDATRLAALLESGARAAKLKTAEVERVQGVVEALDGLAFVVSSDPVVVDRCATWMNLVPLALEGTDAPEPLHLE